MGHAVKGKIQMGEKRGPSGRVSGDHSMIFRQNF